MKNKFVVGLFTLAFGMLALTSCGESNKQDQTSSSELGKDKFKVTYEYPDGKVDEVIYNTGEDVEYNKYIEADCDEPGMKYYFKGFEPELESITETTTVKVLFEKATDLEINCGTVTKNNSKNKNIIIPDYNTTFTEKTDEFFNTYYVRKQYEVDSIASRANLGQFETISLGRFVDSVGSYAFKDNLLLKEIKFKKDCRYEPYCFYGCTNLETVDLNYTKYISTGLFTNCTSLRTVKNFAPEIIENNPFNSCTGINLYDADFSHVKRAGVLFRKDFIAPPKVDLSSCTNLSDEFFGPYDLRVREIILNKDLEELELNDNFKSLEKINIGECTKLKKIKGLNNIQSLRSLDLSKCTELTEIDGFNNAQNLSLLDLSKNTKLQSITGFNDSAIKTLILPKNLSYINGFDNAKIVNNNINDLKNLVEVDGCKGLALENLDLTLFPKLTRIDPEAFVIKNKLTLQKDMEEKPINAKTIELKEGNYIYPLPKVEEVIFAPDANKIGNSLFENNPNLKNIIIPKNVKVIEDDAFRNCSKLAKVDFEDGSRLTNINSCAFLDSHNLAYIETQKCEDLTYIGSSALEGTRLKRLFLKNPDLRCYSQYPKTLAIIYADSMDNVYQKDLSSNLKFLLNNTSFSGYQWIIDSIFPTYYNFLYEDGDGFLYNLNKKKNEARVVSYYGDNRKCVVKDSIVVDNVKYAVTVIESYAFKTNYVTHLKISDSVVDVGNLFGFGTTNIRILELGKNCTPYEFETVDDSVSMYTRTNLSGYNCPAIYYYKHKDRYLKEGFYLDIINKEQHSDIKLIYTVYEELKTEHKVNNYYRADDSVSSFVKADYFIKDNFLFINNGMNCVGYIGEYKDNLVFPKMDKDYSINFSLKDGCTCYTYTK